MKTQFLNSLRFTRAERYGTLAMMLMAIILFAAPLVTQRFHPPQHTDFSAFMEEIKRIEPAPTPVGERAGLFFFNPNTASREDFVRLGLSENVAKTIINYREKGGKFRTPEDFKKIWRLMPGDYERLLPYIRLQEAATPGPIENTEDKRGADLFAFNPNTISETDLFRLGLPSRTVKSILNYRIKGGHFRQKEDLEKIYTLSAEDYARIAGHAVFTPPETAPKSTLLPQKQPPSNPVDINRADANTWMSLPGIGEKRAQQLVAFREKLGGFLSVEQIGEMYGLPDSVFRQMRPWLVKGDTPLRTLNLNTVTLDELDAHPYISKRQAEMMVAYRQHHGAYTSVHDLDNIRAFTDKAWLDRVKPYLSAH
ncbi:MAG: helix-hairpin-helix domain-containing protein [Saprospiraceae bacterium]|nr:helix-hairpin-helix domain-containing protein [Saprospiraceae bacterium]